MNKPTRLRTLLATTALMSGLVFVAAPAMAQSLPDTGNVTSVTNGLTGGLPGSTNPTFNITGAAGAQTLTVNLNDNRTLLNWGGTGFNIAAGNAVYFADTRATGGVTGRTDNIAVLNRVVNGDQAVIRGGLRSDSNVAVYVVSQGGVFFGQNSVVDTGSFFASGLDISDDNDFLNSASSLRFNRAGLNGGYGGIALDGGAQIKTHYSASTNGGRMGDVVLIGTFVETGNPGPTVTAAGDLGIVMAGDVVVQSSPGSPLAFVLNAVAPITQRGNGTVNLYGAFSGSNLTIATARSQGAGSTIISLQASLTATGASVTDRGVTLTTGDNVGNVAYAAALNDSNTALGQRISGGQIDLYGAVTSARDIRIASRDFTSIGAPLMASGLIDLSGGFINTSSGSTVNTDITGGSIAIHAGGDFNGKLTATAGNVLVTAPGAAIHFSGGVQASGNISVTAGSFSEGASVGGITILPNDINAGGDINISAVDFVSVLGKTKGGSLTVNQTSANGYTEFLGTISTTAGNIGMTAAGSLGFQSDITSAGLLTLSAGQYLNAKSVSGTAVSLTSLSSSVRALSASASAGDVQMSGDTVQVSNAVAPNGNISLTAVHGATLGDFYVGGVSSAGGNVTIDSGTTATVRGNLTVGGDLLISGSSFVEIGNTYQSGVASTVQAKGAITVRALTGEVNVNDSTTLLGNSDGIGSEPITFDVNYGITMAIAGPNSPAAAVLGGPNRQSDVQIRFRSLGYMFLGGLQARSLLSAFGNNTPFTSGFTSDGAVYFQGPSTFTNTLKIKTSSALLADNINVTNGDIDVRTTGDLSIRGSLTASGDISLRSSGGPVTVRYTGAHLAAQNVVLSSAGAFDAQDSISIDASGHWVIYSASPGSDTFGGLNSGNTAIWGSTLATRDPSTVSGNRYIFALQPTLTFSTQNLSKVYGTDLAGSDIPFAVTGYQPGVAGVFLGDTAATAWSGSPLLGSAGLAARASVAGGPYATTISGGSLASGSGYAFAFNPGGTIAITPKALIGNVTANSKIYDGTATGSGSVLLSGIVSGDTVGTTGTSFIFSDKNAGFGKTVTISGTMLSGVDSGNYTLTIPATALADILKAALTGVVTVNNKTYNGTTAATGSVSLTGIVAGDSVGTSGTSFTFSDKNAGAGKTVTISGTTLTGADAGNYALTVPATALADILKAVLTGNVTINNKTYDGTAAATGSLILTGAVVGDNVGTTGTSFAFTDKNAGAGKTVNITGTTLTGTDAGNYTLSIPATALADILKAALTGTITVNSKTYDGTTAATGSLGISGVIAGDTVGTTGSTFTFADKNAGIGKTVTLTGTTLTGADAGNYTLTVPSSALADILKAALTGTVTVNNKSYDGTTTGSGSVTLGGVVAGDTIGTGGTSFTFADKNAGTGKTVTISGTTLTGADAGNYTLTVPATALADILKAVLTGNVAIDNKTYDGTTAATGSVSLTGVVAGEHVGTTGASFAFADKNAGAGKTVNVTGTTLTGTDAGNYTLSIPATALADILKAALNGTITVNNKTYDGTTAATGSLSISGAIAGDNVGTTGSTFAFADKNAGTGKTVALTGTTLTGTDAGNYTLTVPPTALADILKAALTGTLTVNTKTYDGTTTGSGSVALGGVIAGDAVGTSGTAFTFADKNAGIGKTVTISGTTLTGADAGNYTLSIPATALADILKAVLTGNVTINNKTYDGTSTATGGVILNGVIAGDAVGISGTNFAFTDKNAGTGKTVNVTGTQLTGTDAGNYTLSIPATALADILKAALTGTITANTKTYDGTTAATGSLSISGAIAGDSVGTTGSTFAFADKNAGAGKTVTLTGTTLTGSDAGNYTLTVPSSALADILKAALTGTVTANTKTYDGTTTGSGSIALNGVIAGDSVGTGGTAFTFSDKNAGTGKTVTVGGTTLTGADAGNYTLSIPATALADILKAVLTGNVTVNNRTYDGTTAATGSVALSGVVTGDNVGTAGTLFAFSDKNAGTGKTVTISGTTLTGTDGGNYTLSVPTTALADILKAALTGSVTANTKTYDGTTTGAGTVALNGVVAGDNVGSGGTVFTFSDKNAGIGKTVTISGTNLTGADAGNYTLTIPASALADILKKALTGTATVNTKTYDGTTTGSGSVALNGVIAGDSVGTGGTAFTFSDKNAGAGKTVTIGGTTLTGSDAGNYTLTLPASALADILKKALTGTVTINGKTYDGTTAATGSVALAGVVSGDTVSTGGTVLAFADKNAGTGKSVTVSGTALTGADAGNYTLSLPASALGDIARRVIALTADNLSKTQGTSDPLFTYTINSGSLVTGDTFNGALTRAAGEIPGPYSITQGSLSAGGNYTLNFTPGTLTIDLDPVTQQPQSLRALALPSQIQAQPANSSNVTLDQKDLCGDDKSCVVK